MSIFSALQFGLFFTTLVLRAKCLRSCLGIEVEANSTINLQQDTAWSGDGSACILSGIFGVDKNHIKKFKSRQVPRSAVVLDDARPWVLHGNAFYREALERCEKWGGTYSEDDNQEVSGYSCVDKRFLSGAPAKRDQMLLKRLKEDAAVRDMLARIFRLDVAQCTYDQYLVTLLKETMTPDEFHTDVCEVDGFSHNAGITVLLWPHDVWNTAWQGNVELSGRNGKPVTGIAPLPNRTLIFDGCIKHRATNCKKSEPVLTDLEISSPLLKVMKEQSRKSYDFKGWRFALALHLECPRLSVSQREL